MNAAGTATATMSGEPNGTGPRCSHEFGHCDCCGADGYQVITAYDPSVYEGAACIGCILKGKASKYPVDHDVMTPIVFLARALRGDEPFASLLAAKEEQSKDPAETERIRQALISEERRLAALGLRRGATGDRPMNRREKRATVARAKKARAKKKAAARTKNAKKRRGR